MPTFQPSSQPTCLPSRALHTCLPAYLPPSLPTDQPILVCRPADPSYLPIGNDPCPLPFPLMQSINLSAYRPADLLPLAYRPSAHPPPYRPVAVFRCHSLPLTCRFLACRFLSVPTTSCGSLPTDPPSFLPAYLSAY